jgi:hypothetical protein
MSERDAGYAPTATNGLFVDVLDLEAQIAMSSYLLAWVLELVFEIQKMEMAAFFERMDLEVEE